MRSARGHIAVFGHYGNQNLGDEAIVQAGIGQIRKRLPGCRIVGCSLRPQDTARRHQVEALGIRSALGASLPLAPANAPPLESMPWKIHARKVAAGLDPDANPAPARPSGVLGILKAIPFLGLVLKAGIKGVHAAQALAVEARFLFSIYLYLKTVDLLLFAGSNQFMDNFEGPWGFPYTVFKWAFLAKLAGAKTAFLSIGANPLRHRLSRWMFHGVLKRADYLSYRDESSKSLMEGRGAPFSGQVYPDLAFGLDVSGSMPPNGDAARVIGINPMPVYDSRYWNISDQSQYRAYVVKLAQLATRIFEAGHQAVFFGTMWRDEYVTRDVIAAMPAELVRKVGLENLIKPCEEVDQLMGVLKSLDVVVATRFHGTLLALLARRPTFGISYYRKNVDLLKTFGLEAYSMELETCDVEGMFSKIMELAASAETVSAKIGRTVSENRMRVEEQWDRVIQLIRN